MPSLWSLQASIVPVQGFEGQCRLNHLLWTGLRKTPPPTNRGPGEPCSFDRTSRRTGGPKDATYAGGCKMGAGSVEYTPRRVEPGWKRNYAGPTVDELVSSALLNGLPTRWSATRPTSSLTFAIQLDGILDGQSA